MDINQRIKKLLVSLFLPVSEDDLDFPRGWLLPVLRDNIRHTQMAHFMTWLTLAARFRKKAEIGKFPSTSKKLEIRQVCCVCISILRFFNPFEDLNEDSDWHAFPSGPENQGFSAISPDPFFFFFIQGFLNTIWLEPTPLIPVPKAGFFSNPSLSWSWISNNKRFFCKASGLKENI